MIAGNRAGMAPADTAPVGAPAPALPPAVAIRCCFRKDDRPHDEAREGAECTDVHSPPFSASDAAVSGITLPWAITS